MRAKGVLREERAHGEGEQRWGAGAGRGVYGEGVRVGGLGSSICAGRMGRACGEQSTGPVGRTGFGERSTGRVHC